MKMIARKLVVLRFLVPVVTNPEPSTNMPAESDPSEVDSSIYSSVSNTVQPRISQLIDLDLWDFIYEIHQQADG